MKEHKKRFRIEFTVDVLNESFNTEDWDWSNESIKSFALQELMCMSPFPEDITFSEVENNWHTGTPTEEGCYVLIFPNELGFPDYCVGYWNGEKFLIRDAWEGDEVKLIAWAKIEPYK